MKKMILFAAAAIFALADCELQSLQWTAFKTPLKLGVKGTFDKIAYTPGKNCLQGAEVIINKHSVDTKNPGRDKTLDSFFFSKLKGDIRAKVKKIGDKTLTVAITLNGVTKEVPFFYEKKGSTLTAKGVIDLFDFSGSQALHSINKACFDKHQGKTWNDVELRFTISEQTPAQKARDTIEQIKSMM